MATLARARWWLAAAALVLLHKLRRYLAAKRRRRRLVRAHGSGSFVPVLEVEAKQLFVHAAAISTVTYFRGPVPDVAEMESRVAAIVARNPWIAGQLRTDEEGGLPGIWIPDVPSARGLVRAVVEPSMTPDMPIGEQGSLWGKYRVGFGADCVDTDRPLVQVVLATAPGQPFWALFFSVCHGVADGATFYELYGMLDSAAELRTLSCRRHRDFAELRREYLGDHLDALFAGATFVKMILLHTCCFWLRSAGWRARASVYALDGDWIERQKRAHEKTPEQPWVSTNDVLMSWWGRLWGLQLLVMVCNMRGRVRGLDSSKAGNYVAMSFMLPEDFQSASAVRAVVQSNLRSRAAMPGFAGYAMRPSIVTNWATFYQHVTFPGCEQIVHFPCFPKWNLFTPAAFIFKANKDELALCCIAYNPDVLESEPAVGRRIA